MTHKVEIETGTPVGTFQAEVDGGVVELCDVLPVITNDYIYAIVTIEEGTVRMSIGDDPVLDPPFGHLMEEGSMIILRNKKSIDRFKCLNVHKPPIPPIPPTVPKAIICVSASAHGDF